MKHLFLALRGALLFAKACWRLRGCGGAYGAACEAMEDVRE